MPIGFNTPAQVAVGSTGKKFIADTGNNRLVVLNDDATFASEITGLTNITGVCVDSSGNIYVAHNNSGVGHLISKYNSSFGLVFSEEIGVGYAGAGHLATDGTHLYVTHSAASVASKRRCSDAVFVASLGTTGSGNGEVITPWGICTDGTHVWVVDAGNSRVQVFTTAGVYVRQWAIGSGARGCAIDSSGNVLVAEYNDDTVKRYTSAGVVIDSFAQANADGIACQP